MEKQSRRFQAAALTAVAAGLLLRLWFLRHAPLLDGDSLIYGGIAKNWLTRGVYGFYSNANGGIAPTLIRLPGYPMFLALCFKLFGVEHYQAVRYVQVAVDLGTCLLLAGTARRLFGGRAGLAVLYLAALCPFTANYVAAPLSETLVLLTIAAAFYAYLRWREAGAGLNCWLALMALSLAYSILLRPDQSLLAVAILPAMLWAARRGSAKSTRSPVVPLGVLVAGILLPLLPWTVRNCRTFGVFQPLAPRYANDPGEVPPLGFARWYRTWAVEFASTDAVYWNYNSFPILPESLPERAFDGGSPSGTALLRQRTIDALTRYNTTELQTPQSEADFGTLARERIRVHPVDYYLLLPFARLADMILRPRTELLAIPIEWWHWRSHLRASLFAGAYALLNLAYLALGIAGFLRWRKSRFDVCGNTRSPDLAWAMAGAILLRCALLLTLDNSEPRYTLEFFPVLLVFSGALFTPPKRAVLESSTHN